MSARPLLASVVTVLVASHAMAVVTPSTRVDTSTSPSFTALWTPPDSFEDHDIQWPVTITPKPGGATEAKVDRSGGQLLEFFGPGLGQYFYATAGIYGVARAEFGVLRAYAYAYGGVAPKAYGPPFVLGTNPYAAIGRSIMRPQFTDGFTAPGTPGAPNVGNNQTLTVQIVLDGSIGGTGSATWLIGIQIVTDASPSVPVYSAFFHTTGCGGPCPFPLTTTPIDVATTVGTSYIIVGDLAVTANATGSQFSNDNGFQVTSIDAANTGKFFVRVKETGAGVVGLSGHDYGAAVPPGDLEIPTTTTLKLPPDMTTTSTTLDVPTTTTIAGAPTTSTTLPGGGVVEDCGNCVDDDGDGSIDAEDPDCCSGPAIGLATKKVRMGAAADAALRMTAVASGAATLGLDPTRTGLSVQLRDPAGGSLLCARFPATAFARKKKGRLFTLSGGGSGIAHLSLRTGKADVTLSLDGKRVHLGATPGGALLATLAVDDASGRRCMVAPQVGLRKTKKGLSYP